MLERIDKIVDKEILNRTIERFRERNIILPTFAEMKNPGLIPDGIKKKLAGTGLWDLDPVNLFRISWKNEPKEKGGLFGGVNFVELPRELTGVKAKIFLLIGKWFPTGAHKVGAAYGCLVPRLVTGAFDPTYHKAVWPSTGNYCRGGAFDSYLMGCTAVAILPEEMSRERFEWLKEVGAEIIATPGCESNVKEIYDKCWEIKRTRKDALILNQFDEFGNGAWHYNVTGAALEEVFKKHAGSNLRFAAYISATGSAGTIAAGDYLKEQYPAVKIVASEALQCPTLLMNGFGGHRIEGIGDKHVPWIHNVRNTDCVTAIDDEDCMRILRLFNEDAGKAHLKTRGIPTEIIDKLPLLGISGISNMLSAIKTANYFELDSNDALFTIATDSAELYKSRIEELKAEKGAYDDRQAGLDFECRLLGQKTDNLAELSFPDKKRVHNLKYYTWIEQQEKDLADLNKLWDDRKIWKEMWSQPEVWDNLIKDFNQRTGLSKRM